MTVYPIGTTVFIGPEGDLFEGQISAIFIRGNNSVLYEVQWWDVRNLRVETVYDFQIKKCVQGNRLTIGFK